MNKYFPIAEKERYALFAVLITAVAIRLHTNFSTEYIGGNNGAYYLVLIRNLLEKGELRYLEFPLLFWLEAAIAYIPYKLGLVNINTAIDFTSRIFDSVIPALSIFPAYLLIKKFFTQEEKWFVPVLIASLSILYFSPLVLISDFQKNSLGLLWLFWLIYFLFRIHEDIARKNYLFAALFFVLTGLTHYGCIAIALSIAVVNLLVTHALYMNWKKMLKALSLAVAIISSCIGLVYLVSRWRAEAFIKIPIEVFHEPVILFLINHKPVLSPLDIINSLIVNIVAASALYLYIKSYQTINAKFRPFIITMIILSFFLASPFLGLYTAQRLYFISYCVAIPLLPFIYNQLGNEKKKAIMLYILSAILILSIVTVKSKKQQSNMSRETYSEMLKLSKIIPKHDKTLIVARHGMEFWSIWIIKVDALREDELTKEYWRWYTDIYFLHQKKDKSGFGPAGAFGPKFPEPALPQGAYLIQQTDYLELYRAPYPPKDFSIFKPRR
jgi:hypothetical protein